ncbi:hypothetical protein GSI_11015 [Ganoderma sinense ZZ0214-1]|uniref:Uncharacterized protein n=1 Tax=Ganoderma sinense ZZ0214-1 TaxID=1077348 RepID=A0A2G8S281_9APHY|nr:hypothetical protein GSI_11015 [Ganoderma sinense ZZ0214-1]
MQDVPPRDYGARPATGNEPLPPLPKQSRRHKPLGPPPGSPAAMLDPPPACFQRGPAPNLSYPPFEPIDVYALKKDLTGGFGSEMPLNPALGYPHPFATHDVALEDWALFTKNVQQAGSLTTGEKVRAHVVGPAIGLAFFPAFLIARAIKKRKIAKKEEPVRELIYHWNVRYFHPRSMHVSLLGPEGLGQSRKAQKQDKRAARKAQRRGETHYGHADYGYAGPSDAGAGSSFPSDGGNGGKWCLRIRYQPQGYQSGS